MSETQPSEVEGKIEDLLDFHGLVYSRSTKQYITAEITESDMHAMWESADQTSKAAVQSLIREAVKQELDEVWHMSVAAYFSGDDPDNHNYKQVIRINAYVAYRLAEMGKNH